MNAGCLFVARNSLTTVLLELPVSVVQRTDLPSLQPSGDAVEMKGVIAYSPSDSALFIGGSTLVCLTLDAEVHDVVSADRTVVNNDVPRPKSNSIPLLHLKPLLAIACSF